MYFRNIVVSTMAGQFMSFRAAALPLGETLLPLC